MRDPSFDPGLAPRLEDGIEGYLLVEVRLYWLR